MNAQEPAGQLTSRSDETFSKDVEIKLEAFWKRCQGDRHLLEELVVEPLKALTDAGLPTEAAERFRYFEEEPQPDRDGQGMYFPPIWVCEPFGRGMYCYLTKGFYV